MAERIVKEVLSSGRTQYIIEENTLFDIPTPIWSIKTIEYNGVPLAAIFDTLEEARKFLSAEPKVINRTVIE